MSIPPTDNDTIVTIMWSVLKWSMVTLVGGFVSIVSGIFGYVLKETITNGKLLSEIKHDTANMRLTQIAQHTDNIKRYDEMLRRIERLETKL